MLNRLRKIWLTPRAIDTMQENLEGVYSELKAMRAEVKDARIDRRTGSVVEERLSIHHGNIVRLGSAVNRLHEACVEAGIKIDMNYNPEYTTPPEELH